ncbi:MAG TPA: tRNA pseudouridine(38-40) synthase TruA [Chloroflexota bacterium]|nr:tRNA pseudouridine(38-40) synthase TruA [Chloroflexota bacterium]
MLPSRVVRLNLAYEGTKFQGFNVQPQRRTVQGVLEAAWYQVMGETIRVTAAGRTDTGVHAAGQVGSVRTSCQRPPAQIVRALNATLPEDVAVLSASDEPEWFDARRSARQRHYRYTIWAGPIRNVFWQRFSWHVPQALDISSMRQASECLLGTHDFRCFAARLARSSVESTRRTVSRMEWSRDDEGFVHLDIAADGFLRRMVRGIVGSLVAVGRGRQGAGDVAARLEGVYVTGRGDFAPPHGLSLTRIDY